jgi:CubicO group peptidase (beta-lactamase class C family)
MRQTAALPTRSFAFAILATLLLLAPIAQAGAQNVLRSDWAEVADEIRPLVDAKMARDGMTGFTIVLVDGDEVVWSEGFGFSDAASGTKATADTMFEIGSVSKTFTGLMLMKLAEEGRLDIDRPLTEYIPGFRLGPPVIDFPKNDRPITVRDMMTHYSGIPGDLFNGLFTTAPDPDFNAKLLEWLSQDSATYPPGYRFSYSNTAVALLANVIEAASGKSFREYSEAFLASIGMSPASFYKDDPALLARLSKGYVEGKELPTTYINIPASGSIVASANQMGRYLRMLLGRGSVDGVRVVKPETLGAMLKTQNENAPFEKGLSMGLSFILTDPEMDWAGKLFWHDGGTVAFQSYMELLPDHGLAAMTIGNSAADGGMPEVLAHQILKSALRIKRGQIPPTKAGAEDPVPATVPRDAQTPERVSLPSGTLEKLSGIYANDDSRRYYIFAARPEGLAWSSKGADQDGVAKDEGLLLPWSDGLFRTKVDASFALEFRETAGLSMVFARKEESRGILGTRYVPRILPEAWKAREGRWNSENQTAGDVMTMAGMPTDMVIRISDGMLVMERNGALLVLDPVSDSVAAVRSLGRIGGSAARVVIADGIERIRFMMNIYRKVNAAPSTARPVASP